MSSKRLDEDIGDRPKTAHRAEPRHRRATERLTSANSGPTGAWRRAPAGPRRCGTVPGKRSSRRFGLSVGPPPPPREPRHRPTWTKPYTPETSNAPEAARDAFSKFPNVSSSSGPMASSDRSKPPNPKPRTNVAGTPSRSSVGAVYDVVQAFPDGEGVERGPSTNASEHPPREKSTRAGISSIPACRCRPAEWPLRVASNGFTVASLRS